MSTFDIIIKVTNDVFHFMVKANNEGEALERVREAIKKEVSYDVLQLIELS